MASNGKLKRQARRYYYKKQYLKYYQLLKKYSWLGHYFNKNDNIVFEKTTCFNVFKSAPIFPILNSPSPIVTISIT